MQNSTLEFINYDSRGEEMIDPDIEAQAQRVANEKPLDSIAAFNNPFLTYKNYNPGTAGDTGDLWRRLSPAERHKWKRVSAIRKAEFDRFYPEGNISGHRTSPSALPGTGRQRYHAHSPSQGKRSSSRRDGVTKRTAQPVPPLPKDSQHPESSLQYCPIPQWAELHSTQSSLNAGGINSAPYFSRNPQPTHMQCKLDRELPCAYNDLTSSSAFSPYTNPPSSSFSSYTQFPEPSSYQTTFVPRSVPYHQQMVPPPMPMYTDPQMQSVGQPNNAGYNGMGPVASPNSFIPWQSGMNDPNGAAYDYLYGDPVAGNAATPQMGDRGEFSSNQWPQREQPHYGQDYGSRNLEYYRRG